MKAGSTSGAGPRSAPGSPALRRGRDDEAEAVAALLYETSTGMYDTYAGGRRSALRILAAAYRRAGNSASRETVTVAELDGAVAGAIAMFPVAEAEARARRFLRLTLTHSVPWRWVAIARVFRLGAAVTPSAPSDALYVDALAVTDAHRRRGVATALLAEAERVARARGLAAVALDTPATNTGAQALYEAAGFEVSERRAALGAMPAIVGYVRRL